VQVGATVGGKQKAGGQYETQKRRPRINLRVVTVDFTLWYYEGTEIQMKDTRYITILFSTMHWNYQMWRRYALESILQ
jgi:hypothetical protein